jgi:hydroxyacylglutathione hydrolase
VRGATEWADGHLPSATHIPLGHLPDRLAEVPADRPVVLQCQAGARSAIAASVLQRLGRTNVINMVGGFAAWQGEGLPVVGSESHEGHATHA